MNQIKKPPSKPRAKKTTKTPTSIDAQIEGIKTKIQEAHNEIELIRQECQQEIQDIMNDISEATNVLQTLEQMKTENITMPEVTSTRTKKKIVKQVPQE